MSSRLGIDPATFEAQILSQVTAWLQQDSAFSGAQTSRERCAHACRVLREEHKPETPFSIIAQVLGLRAGTVYNHWLKYKRQRDEILSRGRPMVLTPDQMTALVQFLLTSYTKGEPATIAEAIRFIENQYRINVIPNTLRHALARDGRIKSVTATPMEDTRMAVTIEQIEQHFALLTDLLTGVPSPFVCNMDEMGHQEWADATEKVCYVPSDLQTNHVNYPVSRKGKRITLIACISADGSFMRPALVISRKTFEDELLLFGYTPDKVEIYDQPNAYIDRDIFIDWFRDTFIPEIQARRVKHNYDGPAFLVMDNCTAHEGEEFRQMCQESNIIAIFLPPHSSNQLQMLDLSIFGVTKRMIARVNKLEKVNVQTTHIHQILQGFYSAATPANIVASFRNAGVSLAIKAETRETICAITPQTARCLIHPMDLTEHRMETEEVAAERDPNQDEYIERVAASIL
jgi:hypothetical protein